MFMVIPCFNKRQLMSEAPHNLALQQFLAELHSDVPALSAMACLQGASFVAVCELTDIFEGSIIRATRRLDELTNELAAAAAVIGDVGLEEKFREAASSIRRDIMFAASLYI